MLATEALRDLTVPAHGKMCEKHVGNLLGRNVAPPDRYAIRTQHCGLVINPVDFAERLSARRAMLVCVPACQDVSNETVLRRDLHLQQAFLSAVFALAPTRTRLQPKIGITQRSGKSSVSCIN